jgi:hypothetical protein
VKKQIPNPKSEILNPKQQRSSRYDGVRTQGVTKNYLLIVLTFAISVSAVELNNWRAPYYLIASEMGLVAS